MKDIVYTRKYTDQKGQERKEYITVGYMFEKEGRVSILMKSYINLSALTNDKGEVWLSVYEHKPKTNNTKEDQPQKETLANSEPTVELVTQVVNEGKEYAKKWEEMSKCNNSEDDIPF